MRTIPFTVLLTVSLPLALPAQEPAEASATASAADADATKAVHAALEDYLRALYDAEPARIERSVSPELKKIGFWHNREKGSWHTSPMTYEQLVQLAGRWNRDGKKVKEGDVGSVEVFEVSDHVACGQVMAVWGVDYAQLVRGDDGRWRIRHLLWQSWPAEPGEYPAPDAAVEAAAAQAATDYAQAYYQAQPELTDRGVHRELVKYGYAVRDGQRQALAMTFDELRKLCAETFAERAKLADPPLEVEVLDRRGRIAMVRLAAIWGFDYMALAEEDGAWRVRQVVWQTPPANLPVRPALKIADAVNASCPFSGRPITADALVRRRGEVVGFCNAEGRDRYRRAPEQHAEALAKVRR